MFKMKKCIVTFILFVTISLCPLTHTWQCNSISLSEALRTHPEIEFSPFLDQHPFVNPPMPLATNTDQYLHPYTGIFKQTFILTIPKGQVYGLDGWTPIDDSLINELVWQNVFLAKDMLERAKRNPIREIKGRVAVITQSGFGYYYHWVAEVLGRLALLEMKKIEYDFLYVPNTAPYMLETLQLWGVNPSKIIVASDDIIVKADELIVPSLVSGVFVNGCPRLVHYIPRYLITYIKSKLLISALQHQNKNHFCKRVFISRQDAASRKIVNEDEVFAALEAHGFVRYHLTKLSLIEQIQLFNNAEIIMGTLGSGLTNVLFCNSNTKIIELYQARRDCTIWNLSHMAGVENHYCIKTTDFIDAREGQYDTAIPVEIINQVIRELVI
jgi:Glycosyltransferase 61